jgi:hypothetical protein
MVNFFNDCSFKGHDKPSEKLITVKTTPRLCVHWGVSTPRQWQREVEFWLSGNEYTGESIIPCVEYTGKSLLPSSEYTGESNLWLPGCEYTGESPSKSNNSLIIVLKSKFFLRVSNGTICLRRCGIRGSTSVVWGEKNSLNSLNSLKTFHQLNKFLGNCLGC